MAISASTLQSNMMAMNAGRMYGINSNAISKNTEKLSSGYRINRAADDAAGLAISEKMRRQVRGLTQASANVQDGISLMQTADGALSQTHDIINRINELAVQAANGTLTDADRSYIQSEVSALGDEIDRIANTTSFNGDIYPLKGTEKEGSFGIDVVEDYTVAMKNESGVDQTLDGKPWPDGSTVEIKGIQMNTNTIDNSVLCYNHFHDGMATYGAKKSAYSSATNVLTYYNGSYSLSKADLKVDDEGYIYYNSKSTNSRMYFLRDQSRGKDMYSRATVKNLSGWEYMKYDPELADIWIQAGSEGAVGMNLHGVDASTMGLGLHPLDVSTQEKAQQLIETVKGAMAKASEYRSYFGAAQNRMEHTVNNIDNVVENTTAAESRIRDTDMSKEMVSFSLNNILQNASQSMISQTTKLPEGVLSLLQ